MSGLLLSTSLVLKLRAKIAGLSFLPRQNLGNGRTESDDVSRALYLCTCPVFANGWSKLCTCTYRRNRRH
jgi:hypothetical protein